MERATGNSTDLVFVPVGAEVKDADREKAARMGYVSDESVTYTRLGNACWFITIDHKMPPPADTTNERGRQYQVQQAQGRPWGRMHVATTTT